jgi:hypothetical protein
MRQSVRVGNFREDYPMRPVDMIVSPEWKLEPVTAQTTRVSRRVGFEARRNTMVIPVSMDRIAGWIAGGRGLIQDVFPDLSADDREFLMSGMTPEDWKRVFG